MASARKFQQARRTGLLKATEPFADGRHDSGEQACSGFAATMFGALDEPQTMVVSVLHRTHQIEIMGGSSHGATIAAAAGGSPPSRAAISNRLFSLKHRNAARGIRCEQALPRSPMPCPTCRCDVNVTNSQDAATPLQCQQTPRHRLQRVVGVSMPTGPVQINC